MGKSRRGGRKKTANVQREPNGRISRSATTGPTPELAHHRAMLVRGGDPNLSSTPIGCLKARHLIDDHGEAAAETYQRAYRIRYGTGMPRGIDLVGDHGGGDGPSEGTIIWARQHLATAYERMAGLPRRHRDLFDNFVVFERPRDWLRWPVLSAEAIPELAIILAVLARLSGDGVYRPQRRDSERAEAYVPRNYQQSAGAEATA